MKGSVRIHFQFHLLPGILLCHFCHPLLLSFAVPFKTSVVYIMNSEYDLSHDLISFVSP